MKNQKLMMGAPMLISEEAYVHNEIQKTEKS